jgi:hypothetical protein
MVSLGVFLLIASAKEPTFAVDWPIDLPVIACVLGVAGSLTHVAALIIVRAESADRRRYFMAGLALVGSPALSALVTKSVFWFADGRYAFGPRMWPATVLGLFIAIVGSASAAFLLPIRSPRERGVAVVGGAVLGFIIHCVALATMVRV